MTSVVERLRPYVPWVMILIASGVSSVYSYFRVEVLPPFVLEPNDVLTLRIRAR